MARLYIPTTSFTVEAGKKFIIPAGVRESRDNREKMLVWSEPNGCIDQRGNFTAPKVEKDTIFTVSVLRLEDPNDQAQIAVTVKPAEAPKPDYNIIKSEYAGLWETVRSNWEKVLENPLGFLRTHFLRPTIATIIAFLFLWFAGGGELNTILGIILGILAAWKISTRSLGLAVIVAVLIPLICYIFPNALVGPLKFGIIMAYLIGGIFYLVEIMSRDKKGKPKLNWFPAVPIVIFAIMMALNFFGTFSSVVPERQTAPKERPGKIYLGKNFGQESGRINLSKNDSLVSRTVKKPASKITQAIENASKDVRDMFDWLACILILVAYIAAAEFTDVYNKGRKEGNGKGKDGEKAKQQWWRETEKTLAIIAIIEMIENIVQKSWSMLKGKKPEKPKIEEKPKEEKKGAKK